PGEIVGDLVEPRHAFGEGRTLRPHIGVVEGEEGNAQNLEHLEGDIGLELRMLHRVAEPGALDGLAAEGVASRPDEIMPVADGETQMVLQALAENLLVRIVMAEGQRIAALRPLVANRRQVAEKSSAHAVAPRIAG